MEYKRVNKMDTKKKYPIQSIKNAFDVLNILLFDVTDGSGISLSDLSNKMGKKNNSVHNILKTMVACGYVGQRERGKYTVGVRCREIGLLNNLQSESTMSIIESACERASVQIGEAIVFITLTGGKRMTLLHFDSQQMVLVNKALFEQNNIYATPTGRILTSFCDEAQRELIIEQNGLPGTDWDNIDSAAKLNAAGKQIRKQGNAVISNEKSELIQWAVPVFSADNKFIGAIGCYAPKFRWENKNSSQAIVLLFNAAIDIKQKINI